MTEQEQAVAEAEASPAPEDQVEEQILEERIEQPATPAAAGASGPRLLTAAEILASEDLSHVDVPVPEWTPKGEPEPRCVRLLELSASEAIGFTDSIQEGARSKNKATVNIIRLTAVDEDGNKLFADKGAMARMLEKSNRVYLRLANAALKLNGFIDDDEDEDGDEAAKND